MLFGRKRLTARASENCKLERGPLLRRMIIPWGQVSNIPSEPPEGGAGEPLFLTLLPATIGRIGRAHLAGSPAADGRARESMRTLRSPRGKTP